MMYYGYIGKQVQCNLIST